MAYQGPPQVNVNTGPDDPRRNQMLMLGAVVFGILLIILIYFLVRPGSGSTANVTATPTGAAARVATLPETGTTPGVGQATVPPGNGEAGPTEAATAAATPESTPAELPTAAASPPAGDAGPVVQQVETLLQATSAETGILDVRQNGPDILEIDFKIPQSGSVPEAAEAAKGQVRTILAALSALPVDLGRVTLSGFYDLPGQPNSVPVKLDYLSDTIKTQQWASMSSEAIYSLSDVQAIKDEFK
jgi:hypothetical protein